MAWAAANVKGAVPTHKLLAAFVFFAAAFTFTDVMSGICMWRMPKGPGWPTAANASIPVLPDIGFSLIPFVERSTLPTHALLVFLLVTLAYVALTGRLRLVLCRFFVIDGVLLCLRSITIVSTSLNNADPRCNHCGSVCPTTMWGCILMTLEKFPFFSCGDYMFSGHTVHFFLCALIFQTYFVSFYHEIVYVLAWAWAVLGMALLLACRVHYSIDVLVGASLTVLVWYYYHNQASKRLRPGWQPSNAAESAIAWFEADIVPADGNDSDEKALLQRKLAATAPPVRC